jgi:hypothetical protein
MEEHARDFRDKADDARVRHGRSRHNSFVIGGGGYIQPPPMLFTRDMHPIWLGDVYKGASCFLIMNGPSLLENDLSLLNNPGFLTMGVNNGPKVFRL